MKGYIIMPGPEAISFAPDDIRVRQIGRESLVAAGLSLTPDELWRSKIDKAIATAGDVLAATPLTTLGTRGE